MDLTSLTHWECLAWASKIVHVYLDEFHNSATSTKYGNCKTTHIRRWRIRGIAATACICGWNLNRNSEVHIRTSHLTTQEHNSHKMVKLLGPRSHKMKYLD